jgi:hypothetical protein
MSKWIDPTQQVLDVLKRLDEMDAARKIEDAMEVIRQLEVVNDVRRLAETLNREAAEHGIVEDTEFERGVDEGYRVVVDQIRNDREAEDTARSAEKFLNSDGSLPMAAAASELLLDDLLGEDLTGTPRPDGPEGSPWWNAEVCPECADTLGGPNDEVSVTISVKLHDGEDFAAPFRVHECCALAALRGILASGSPAEAALVEGELLVTRALADR